MARFWEHGYAGTSVRDLGAAMGLGAASLYNAFGDKHALFTRCLDRYLDAGMRERISRLEATETPRRAIERYLHEIAELSLASRRGCLLVNTALELAPHDGAIGQEVAERLKELEGFFRRCVLRGQRNRSITRARPARRMAALLMTTVLGIRVLARTRGEAGLLFGTAREAAAILGPAPS